MDWYDTSYTRIKSLEFAPINWYWVKVGLKKEDCIKVKDSPNSVEKSIDNHEILIYSSDIRVDRTKLWFNEGGLLVHAGGM